ncbi:MAG: leucine-rich repeat domain-containing protein, partial [Clostridia bacterium]|nr:leucine-rich repeat domain-containing protein [Clostridia bacterium]
KAFSECKNLEEIVFGKKLEELKYFNTKTLTNFVFKENENYVYENEYIIDKRTNTIIYGTGKKEIPSYVKIIGKHSLENRNVESIILPEGIEIIDEYAFSGCLFETIKLPSSLKRIEKCAFLNCPNLLYATIPSNVEFVGTAAFDVAKIMTIVFDGFDGTVEEGAFSYHSIYTCIECNDYIEMCHFGSKIFAKGANAEFIIYNAVFKEDNGEKYVYSIDMKNVLLSEIDVEYALCYRKGYILVGWSFIENSNVVDIPIVAVERVISYDGFTVDAIKKFNGFTKFIYLDKQKEYGTSMLYAIWKKKID